jgi:hypothetical protein
VKTKLLLLLILLLTGLLVGCAGNKVEYLDKVNLEMNVCREDCSDNRTMVLSYLEKYPSRVDILYENFQPLYGEELNILRNGEVYSREDIPREDLFESNYDIPLFYPLQRLGIFLSEVFVHIKNTSDDGSPVYSSNYSNFLYLFNENEGFISYTISDGSESERRYSFSIKFVDEGLEYLVTQYNVFDDNYDYVISFKDGVYREYHYDADDSYTFMFIDIMDYRYLRFGYLSGEEFFIYHDSDKGIRYEQLKTGLRKVTFYDGLEYVCSLNDKSDDYLLSINGHFLDDWDELHLRPESLTPYSALYAQNERVYEDYSIIVRNQGLRYYIIDVSMNLSESETDDWVFPETFDKEVSFLDLLQKFNDFTNLEANLDLLGMKESDLLEHIKITLMKTEEE